MDLEKINKMLGAPYRSPDNTIAKEYLLKMFPELKYKIASGKLKNNQDRCIYEKDVLEYGIKFKNSGILSFHREDFPELFEENK